MKRTPITPNLSHFPEVFHSFLEKYPVYDSSCSQDARVYFLDGEGGMYLKSAPKGSLKAEADMTRYFYNMGLSAEVLDWHSGERDFLVTRAVPGEDCLNRQYLSDPRRLCDTLAGLLRQLHDTEAKDCPVTDRCGIYLREAKLGHAQGLYEEDLFPPDWGFSSADEAWTDIEANAKYLKNDALLHGDYCLPNILLQNWAFSGFIDLGKAGLGDRHFDILWGAWTLNFNLKTNVYFDRFLDCYGRDKIQPEKLRTCAALECYTT